jgi:hypothetical protein
MMRPGHRLLLIRRNRVHRLTLHSARSLLTLTLLVTALSIPQTIRPISAAGSTTATFFLLTNTGSIVAVTEALPSQPAAPVATTGVTAGETLVGIDVRPQNGRLYGLGINATANIATLYLLNPQSGLATAVGTAGQIAFTTNGTTPVDLPDPVTTGYGIDFNPAADRLRIVTSTGLNFRVNLNTGAPVDGDNTGLTSGTVTGTNPDGSINSGTTTVDGAAYTNNTPNNGNITTLYTIDATSNQLFIQNPANTGTQTSGQTVTLNGSTLDFSSNSGFDIPPGVNAASSNAAVANGSAAAALTVGGVAGLYQINLVNGQATLIGTLGSLVVRDLAIWAPLPIGNALTANGTSLIRFRLDSSGTTTTQAIGAITAGETLVGIDGRPQTGQLYTLGVNATANTATLYLLDPQTGAVTAMGTPGQIAFVNAVGNPVDLPDPATAGYGIDFNPTVDRLRVVTSTGLNFRVNPNNGAPVDGDIGGAAGSVTGINTDGPVSGSGSTGVSATAYTNNYSQQLSGTPTTLYTLDAASNALFIQNPPNAGTQTSQLAITLAGAPLDFTNANGFDIPPGASVLTANAPATGNAYALLTVGGSTGLYRIALATGAATFLGALGAGATSVAGFVAWSEAPSATLTTATTTVSEGVGSVDLTVTSTGGTPLVMSYLVTGGTATAGSDYTATSGTLVLGNTTISQTFSLPIINDTTIEGNETVDIQLLGADGVQQTLTLTIADNDAAPGVSLSAVSYTGSEISGTAVLTVTLNQALSTSASVQYATTDGTAKAGSDYTAISGTLTFDPGQTSKTLTVPILSDPNLDVGEIFIVTLSAPVNVALVAPSSAGVTITDDRPIYVVYMPLVRR